MLKCDDSLASRKLVFISALFGYSNQWFQDCKSDYQDLNCKKYKREEEVRERERERKKERQRRQH